MTQQPESLRLADWLDGSSNGTMDARHKAAAELRRLHGNERALETVIDSALEAIKEKDSRITTLEAALGQAVDALEQAHIVGGQNQCDEAINAAKQALEGNA